MSYIKAKTIKRACGLLMVAFIWSSCSNSTESSNVVSTLQEGIAAKDLSSLTPVLDESLSAVDVSKASKLYMDYIDAIDRSDLKEEWEAKSYKYDKYTMPIKVRYFGPDKNDRSLIISLHGGGSTTKEANDQQWRNQIRLYNNMKNAVYVAPRAAVDAWNMWHQSHVDTLLEKIIRSYILFDGVDVNKVYITGYSAGGDGVYQLAPRFADRLAAADMNAGHPNEVTPIGLRNLPFALFMGANDAAYHRNDIARNWKIALDSLRAKDPNGYEHLVEVVPGKGHWMDHKDSLALDWMVQFKRNINPNRVVWVQDDVKHHASYWLSTDIKQSKAGNIADVVKKGNTFIVKENTFPVLHINYTPSMIDPSKPIVVEVDGKKTEYQAKFTLRNIVRTADIKHDYSLIYAGSIQIK
ncbi:hypothetical protein K4L44_02350 [Halosquirtibacter laminarini]|uniref:Uncharacterized protein n=1 Tax=Halosquirtibacter laminarini TaxID=3374600 RepID=A0AC61NGQ5_9BACT|nr:hypothetical protein K4L44_02350 [Prolixibacteraceae bacterium]